MVGMMHDAGVVSDSSMQYYHIDIYTMLVEIWLVLNPAE